MQHNRSKGTLPVRLDDCFSAINEGIRKKNEQRLEREEAEHQRILAEKQHHMAMMDILNSDATVEHFQFIENQNAEIIRSIDSMNSDIDNISSRLSDIEIQMSSIQLRD